jgi:pimeloyl-ACP methyl ester carboxylesterase
MKVQAVTDLIAPDGHMVPGALFVPESPRSGALLIHPYGAAKEHLYALAVAVAERDIAALAIDLCGHGRNMTPIGPGMVDEVEAGLQHVRRYGRVGAIGLSLGGRLALMSSANYAVAISPAVVAEVSPQGKWMFENFPSPAVREPYPGYAIELLELLGPVPGHDRACLLLYAERDIPAILDGAAGLKAALPRAEVRYITTDLRPDVQHENGMIRYLPRWFNHGELKLNLGVIELASNWAAEQQTVAQPA